MGTIDRNFVDAGRKTDGVGRRCHVVRLAAAVMLAHARRIVRTRAEHYFNSLNGAAGPCSGFNRHWTIQCTAAAL
jgi:hypothetical protein